MYIKKWKPRALKNKPRKEKALTVETWRGVNRSSIGKIWSINYLSFLQQKPKIFSLKTRTEFQFLFLNKPRKRQVFLERERKKAYKFEWFDWKRNLERRKI